MKQTMDQGAATMSMGWMNNESGRFRDNNDVVVFKKNEKIEILRDKRRRLGWRENNMNRFAPTESISGFFHFTVDQDIPAPDKLLNSGTSQVGTSGMIVQQVIESFAGLGGQDRKSEILLSHELRIWMTQSKKTNRKAGENATIKARRQLSNMRSMSFST